MMGQCRRELWENELVPLFQLQTDRPQKRTPHTCCTSFVRKQQKQFMNWVLKKTIQMAREWKVRVQIQVCLQGREKALEARDQQCLATYTALPDTNRVHA